LSIGDKTIRKRFAIRLGIWDHLYTKLLVLGRCAVSCCVGSTITPGAGTAFSFGEVVELPPSCSLTPLRDGHSFATLMGVGVPLSPCFWRRAKGELQYGGQAEADVGGREIA